MVWVELVIQVSSCRGGATACVWTTCDEVRSQPRASSTGLRPRRPQPREQECPVGINHATVLGTGKSQCPWGSGYVVLLLLTGLPPFIIADALVLLLGVTPAFGTVSPTSCKDGSRYMATGDGRRRRHGLVRCKSNPPTHSHTPVLWTHPIPCPEDTWHKAGILSPQTQWCRLPSQPLFSIPQWGQLDFHLGDTDALWTEGALRLALHCILRATLECISIQLSAPRYFTPDVITFLLSGSKATQSLPSRSKCHTSKILPARACWTTSFPSSPCHHGKRLLNTEGSSRWLRVLAPPFLIHG